MEKRTLQLKDPAELRPHPLKKSLPKAAEWQKGGDSFNALLEDVRERGIDTPLLITSTNEILDGEIRWLAAKALRLDEVPTLEVPFACAASMILGSLLQRQHLSKSALAYLAFPLLAPAIVEARRRHHARLRTGNAGTIAHGVRNGDKTTGDLAAEMGICRRLVEYAGRLHALFVKTPALRAEWETKILSGECALGASLAGIAGGATGGARIGDQLLLFTAGFDMVTKRFSYWQKFDEVTKERARKTIHETVAAMPEDLREEFQKALRAANSQRRAA
jgi:hypothetical protein